MDRSEIELVPTPEAGQLGTGHDAADARWSEKIIRGQLEEQAVLDHDVGAKIPGIGARWGAISGPASYAQAVLGKLME